MENPKAKPFIDDTMQLLTPQTGITPVHNRKVAIVTPCRIASTTITNKCDKPYLDRQKTKLTTEHLLNDIKQLWYNTFDPEIHPTLTQLQNCAILGYAAKLPPQFQYQDRHNIVRKIILSVINRLHESYNHVHLFQILSKIQDERGDTDYLKAKILMKNEKLAANRDIDRAFFFFDDAINRGNMEALMDYAKMHESGHLWGIDISQWVTPDIGISINTYAEAARQGNDLAIYYWAKLMKNDPSEHLRTLNRMDILARKISPWDNEIWCEVLLFLAELYASSNLFIGANQMAYLWALVVKRSSNTIEHKEVADKYASAISSKELAAIHLKVVSCNGVNSNVASSLWNEAIETPMNCIKKAQSLEQNEAKPEEITSAPALDTPDNTENSQTPALPGSAYQSKNSTHHQDTNEKQYSFLSKYKSEFDISNVKLNLAVNNRNSIKNIRITYKGTDSEIKYTKWYEEIGPDARKILICLACVVSKQGDESGRRTKLDKIISNADSNPISRLNKMLRDMFPNCGLQHKSTMIDKQGRVLNFENLGFHESNRPKCSKCKYD